MLNWIDKLTDTIQEYDKGILDNPKISNPENELLRYLKYYKNRLLEHLDCLWKQKNYHKAKERCEIFFSKLFYNKMNNIKEIPFNHDTMLEIQSNLRQKYSKHYAYEIIKNIRAFLNYAIKQDFYEYNEYKKIEFLQAPKSQKRKVIISMDDFKDMLLYCNRKGNLDFKYYLMTLFFTGSRPSEIITVTYKDIDLKNNHISIWMNKIKKYKTVGLNSISANELMNIIKF